MNTPAILIFLPGDRDVFQRDEEMRILVRLDRGRPPGREVQLSLGWRVRGTGVAAGPEYTFDLTLLAHHTPYRYPFTLPPPPVADLLDEAAIGFYAEVNVEAELTDGTRLRASRQIVLLVGDDDRRDWTYRDSQHSPADEET
ncbi:MAG: hypothetical protein U0359_29065 [Byssovorax sp.]